MSKHSLDDILAAHSGPPTSGKAPKGPALTDKEAADQKHIYRDPRTGERVTSVTSVVGAFDSGDKLGRGARAAVKLEREGKRYEDEWGDKRDTGTRVHNYAELWVNGKTAEVADEDREHMDAFETWCNMARPEWLETEVAVIGRVPCPFCGPPGSAPRVHPCPTCKGNGFLSYGGRFDAIGAWDDLFWLTDYKTGRSYRPELTLQLAGYAHADGIIEYDANGMATGLRPLPEIQRWAGLYIRADGVEVVEAPDPGKVRDDWTIQTMQEQAWLAFKSLLYVKAWGLQINRKGL